MHATLGTRDREKLDQYLTSVRELEQRLASAEDWEQKPKPKTTAKPPEDEKDHRERFVTGHDEMFEARTDHRSDEQEQLSQAEQRATRSTRSASSASPPCPPTTRAPRRAAPARPGAASSTWWWSA